MTNTPKSEEYSYFVSQHCPIGEDDKRFFMDNLAKLLHHKSSIITRLEEENEKLRSNSQKYIESTDPILDRAEELSDENAKLKEENEKLKAEYHEVKKGWSQSLDREAALQSRFDAMVKELENLRPLHIVEDVESIIKKARGE